MSSNISVTDQPHNDYVGTDANKARIPGASEATTGHQYEAVFPRGGHNLSSTVLAMLNFVFCQSPDVLRSTYRRPPDVIVPRGTTLPHRTSPATLGVRDTVPIVSILRLMPFTVNDDVTPETNPFGNRGAGAAGQRDEHDLNQPRDGDVYVDRDPYAESTRVADTLTGMFAGYSLIFIGRTSEFHFVGATSQDVHRGIGKPLVGQTSYEMHHDGHQTRKRFHEGLQANYGDKRVPRNESEIDRSRDEPIAD